MILNYAQFESNNNYYFQIDSDEYSKLIRTDDNMRCYRCNQRKGNMDWEKWSDVLKNRQFNESSKNLENRRLISDLFLSVADEYNIKECQWNKEDSGSWLGWYNEGNLINHFDLQNWTSNESYILQIFYRGNQHQQFSEDLDRFLERLRKFGFKNFKAQKENYTLRWIFKNITSHQ